MGRSNRLLLFDWLWVGTTLGSGQAFAGKNDMEFLVNKASQIVFANGYILPNSDLHFATKLRRAGISDDEAHRYTVMFQSPGGSVIGSMRLGVQIRRYKMSTEVGRPRLSDTNAVSIEPGDCTSACVWSFLGGVQRSIGQQDRLSIHRMSGKFDKTSIDAVRLYDREEGLQKITGELMRYVKGMGVDTQVVVESLGVSALDRRVLTPQEMKKWRVIGTTIDPKVPHLPLLKSLKRHFSAKPPAGTEYGGTPTTGRSYQVFGVRSDDVLNVRSGPSTDNGIIGSIPSQARGIRIVGRCVNSWCHIRYRQILGYVNRRYIKSERTYAPRGYRVVHVAPDDYLNLRLLPTDRSPVVTRLPPDARGISIIGRCKGSWCNVRYKRFSGWVDGTYLEAN